MTNLITDATVTCEIEDCGYSVYAGLYHTVNERKKFKRVCSFHYEQISKENEELHRLFLNKIGYNNG